MCQSDLIFLARFGAAHEGGPFDLDVIGGDRVIAGYYVLCFIEQRRVGFGVDDDVVVFFLINPYRVIHQIFFIRDIVLVRRYGFFVDQAGVFGNCRFLF